MTQEDEIQQLLESIATGKITPDQAMIQLKSLQFESVGDFAKIDHHRSLRTGFPEVIWGLGKTPKQIAEIMLVMQKRNNPVVMATRIEPEVYEYLREKISNLRYYEQAKICAIAPHYLTPYQSGTITILSAGTSDLPIAEEAAVTAELCGFEVQRLWDVGVAGIHRLLHHKHLIMNADILIVVAGMEGALPSVVGGLVDCPVIAVPTSIGYGASFQGLAALLSMLNSCAAGIGVVNIDNGFGAAILAGQILRTAQRLNHKFPH